MADIDTNFTCYNSELSHTNVTPRVWMIPSEGSLHEKSILAAAICQTLIIAVGIPWNIMVLAFIVIKKHYKEATYILLTNLVFADLLVCLCVLPFNIGSAFTMELNISNSDYARCQVCHTIVILILSLVYVSLYTLALMSVDRFIYIKWPIKYENKVTTCRTLFLLLGIWAFCIIISLPPVFGFGEIKFASILSSCSLIIRGETPITANINYAMFLALTGLFPFVTTFIVNIWLLAIVCKNIRQRHTKSVESNNSGRKDSETLRRNSERKLMIDYHKRQILLAQVFGAIFTDKVITWVPLIFIAAISAVIGSDRLSAPAFTFVYLAYTCQPAIHPILETCIIGKAKVTLFRFICFCKRKTKKESQF